jgi:oligoendopeptidase F
MAEKEGDKGGQACEDSGRIGLLPRWDLGDFYEGFEDRRLEEDVAWVLAEARSLEELYKGKMEELGGDDLASLIERWECMEERAGKVMSFAHLSHTVALLDEDLSRRVQHLRERLQEADEATLFIVLYLRSLSSEACEDLLLSSERLRGWGAWLRDVREWSPYRLSDELELYIAEQSVVGRESWSRLFDETMARMRCDVGGEKQTLTEALHGLTDRKESVRKASAEGLGVALKEEAPLLTHMTNTLTKMKILGDKRRGFGRPDLSRHVSNLVEEEVVDACVGAVKANYENLSHRYYEMKAGWMGKEKLEAWDRLAPPPGREGGEISWSTACEEVLEGFDSFSPRLGEIGRYFFDEGNSWIDAKPCEGKASGAFSASTVPSVHPYIMMNYKGKKRDVMTLAHELGHGVHQWLAGRAQGYFRSSTPLTLAETASVFGEMLVFRRLLSHCETEEERFVLLSGKVEDMLATVVRQVSFYDFEYRVHEARKEGPLTTEDLKGIWCEISRESLGPFVKIDEEMYGYNWSYIPHFIHTPFYVYSYAFGDCLVNGLYRCYQEGLEGFEEKYEELLSSGGQKRHKELLRPFGIDATDKNFWQGSLDVIGDMISELSLMKVPPYEGGGV